MASKEPLRSFEHEVGEPRAVPVLFIHGRQAIIGGSVVRKVNVWNVFLGKMPPLPIPSTFHSLLAGFVVWSPHVQAARSKVLALAVSELIIEADTRARRVILNVGQAYYEAGLEPKDYSFFIATGLFNEGADSICIIWKAEDLSE